MKGLSASNAERQRADCTERSGRGGHDYLKGRYGELKSCKWFAVPELIQLCRNWLFGAGEQGKQQRGNEWRWEHVSKK